MVQLNKENLPRVWIRYDVRWHPTGGPLRDSVLMRPLSGSTHTDAVENVKLRSRAACSIFQIDVLADYLHQSLQRTGVQVGELVLG